MLPGFTTPSLPVRWLRVWVTPSGIRRYLSLKNTSAASVQLSVPVIAALGGIVFLGEPMTLRLMLASVAILGGIALVIVQKR